MLLARLALVALIASFASQSEAIPNCDAPGAATVPFEWKVTQTGGSTQTAVSILNGGPKGTRVDDIDSFVAFYKLERAYPIPSAVSRQ